MDKDIEEALRSILTQQRETRQEIDDLASSLGRLVKELDADDRREERVAERDERERDKLYKSLDDLKQRIENVGAGMRDMPERMLATIEKKIYELRVARWEALQAGVANEPAPLMPPPVRRDPTGPYAIGNASERLQRVDDDDSLTPAQQRKLFHVFARSWRWVRWVLLPAVGAGVHHLVELIRHIGH